jgi:hypothetical protein
LRDGAGCSAQAEEYAGHFRVGAGWYREAVHDAFSYQNRRAENLKGGARSASTAKPKPLVDHNRTGLLFKNAMFLRVRYVTVSRFGCVTVGNEMDCLRGGVFFSVRLCE